MAVCFGVEGELVGLAIGAFRQAAGAVNDVGAFADDVHLLRGMDPGASVFDLTLAIAEGRRGRALSILARNLEAGEALAHPGRRQILLLDQCQAAQDP